MVTSESLENNPRGTSKSLETIHLGLIRRESTSVFISIDGLCAQLLFDADELIVLGDAVGAAHRTRLDLSRIGGDGDIGYRGVFGFARTMRGHRGISVAVGHFDGIKRLGERTYLIHFYQDGIGCTCLDSLFPGTSIRDKQVVAHNLTFAAQRTSHLGPSIPVVLVKSVFDGINRIRGNQMIEIGNLLIVRQFLCPSGLSAFRC